MSIHQHKDGRWFVAFRESGSRAVKRKYFGRGSEAKVLAKKFEAELSDRQEKGRPLTAEAPALTFYELAQRYLNARPLTERTRQSMVYALNLHVLPRWGHLPVAQLTMAHLAEVDESLSRLGRALGTRNRVRAYCRAIAQWGLDNDLAAANPFSRFRPETKREGKAPDLITVEELRAIYAAAPKHLKWTIEVMMHTGVRPGATELFALKMSDVDHARGGIWVARRKTHDPKAILPLKPAFLAKLKHLAETDPTRVYVVEYAGRQVGNMKTSWRSTLRRAGITRRLRLYDLRHWFASSLLSGGADLKATSELLGHASPNTTLSTYYHLLERQKRAAMDHLEIPNLADG